MELYDVPEESFTIVILADDLDVMDEKKMTSEIVENKESPRLSSLQSHKKKYILVLPNSVPKPFHPRRKFPIAQVIKPDSNSSFCCHIAAH